MGQTPSACPDLRDGHLSAIFERQMLVWGGGARRRGENCYFSHGKVWSLNLADSSWSERISTYKKTEDVPNHSSGSQIAVFGSRQIYQFGGVHWSDFRYFNDLHKLDGMTLEWKQIVPREFIPEGRAQCGLCILGDHLAMMGGNGRTGLKNDVWLFSLKERCWRHLQCDGRKPSPRRGHSFTSIDEKRAVLLGGRNAKEALHDSFVLKVDTKEWIEISSTLRPSQFPRCFFHSAICVNVPKKGQYLFVFWGRGGDAFGIVSTAVIIELRTMAYTKVDLPDILPSSSQTVCSAFVKGNLLHFIRFGGFCGEVKPKSLLEKLKWDPNEPRTLSRININVPTIPIVVEDGLISKEYRVNYEDFEFDEEDDFLNGGGYGEVYRANLKTTGETVAVKVIFRRRRVLETSALLNKEAKILFSIKPHPHIVEFVGVCDSPRCYALLMEFISGGDLGQLLDSSSPEIQKWENRLDISRQVALGMAHLHGNTPPVIHLDLKSNNVLIKTMSDAARRPYLCKICDFGIAKMKEVSSLTGDRSDGRTPSGTVASIAPERYNAYGPGSSEEKLEVAKKSDVFSYGVLLWEIREGESPFKGLPKDAIQHKIRSGDGLPEKRTDSPKGFDELLEGCSAFDPADRPSFCDVGSFLLERVAVEDGFWSSIN